MKFTPEARLLGLVTRFCMMLCYRKHADECALLTDTARSDQKMLRDLLLDPMP